MEESDDLYATRFIHSIFLIEVRRRLQKAFYERDVEMLLVLSSMIQEFESEPGEIAQGIEIFESFLRKLDWHLENGVPLYIQNGSARPKGSSGKMLNALLFTAGFRMEHKEVMMLYPSVDGVEPIVERAFILPAHVCEIELNDKRLLTNEEFKQIAINVAKEELTKSGFTIDKVNDSIDVNFNITARKGKQHWGILVEGAFYPYQGNGPEDLKKDLAHATIEGEVLFGIYSVGLENSKKGEEKFTHNPKNYSVSYHKLIPLAVREPEYPDESSLWLN
jgi:hypothetical protein